MRRTVVLLLLLPLVMAPKIAWDLEGLTADVVTVSSVRADRPFPVILVVKNVSGQVQEDAVIRVTLRTDQQPDDYQVIAPSAACGSVDGSTVWCSLGDVAAGEKLTVHFIAKGTTSGELSTSLDRAGELD